MKPIDIKGKRFGRLKVLKNNEASRGTGHAHWICKCDCGTIKSFRAKCLWSGASTSCGCYSRELSSKRLSKYARSKAHKGKGNPAYKHGETNTPLFKIYQGIIGRCQIKSSGNYKIYGGRGIKCEWESYLDFKKDMYNSYIKHLKKFGTKNTTIDRINVNGNYCKENCRWATIKEQANNRTANVYYTYKGITKTAKEWSEGLDISYTNFLKRLKTMSIEEAINMPRLRKRKKT